MTQTGTIVELRRYRLHPGTRATLVRLFDEHFLDAQHDEGMVILGQFEDLDDPGRFVWLRAFPDLASRGPALRRFYGGPVWAALAEEANATMIAWDDVLVLGPAAGEGPLVPPEPADAGRAAGVVVAALWTAPAGGGVDLVGSFRAHAAPVLDAARVPGLPLLATVEIDNEFPRLPIRTDVEAVLAIVRLPDARAERALAGAFGEATAAAVASGVTAAWMRLAPTPRSRLR